MHLTVGCICFCRYLSLPLLAVLNKNTWQLWHLKHKASHFQTIRLLTEQSASRDAAAMLYLSSTLIRRWLHFQQPKTRIQIVSFALTELTEQL